MKPLHISLNTAHSECKPSSTISSFANSLQDFLPLPAHLTPATTFLQADTQSSPLLRSTCPNHLNLPRLTTSATLCIPRRLYKSTLCFLSFSDTPHIHLTIFCSVLSRLCRPRAFAISFPSAWNSLPVDLRDPGLSLMIFRRRLKTYLFSPSGYLSS